MATEDPTANSPASLLDLPDDVILLIATICSERSMSTKKVPELDQVHRRFTGVLGEDFWKQWCRRAGFGIRKLC